MFDDSEVEGQLSLFDDDGSIDYDEYWIDDIFGMSYEDYINELVMEKKELF